jgi:hypothetical protein
VPVGDDATTERAENTVVRTGITEIVVEVQEYIPVTLLLLYFTRIEDL